MPKIHLIEGSVGSGKSRFAHNLSEEIGAPHFNLDSWMATLFRPDRPPSFSIHWYAERKERCIRQIWEIALKVLHSNCDVILELGLVQYKSRKDFYTLAKGCGHNLLVYVLDAPREVRRERVQYRNLQQGDTYVMEVSDDIFEMASNMWEEPDELECSTVDIKYIYSEANN